MSAHMRLGLQGRFISSEVLANLLQEVRRTMVIQHLFGYIAGMSLGLSITSLVKGFIYSFGRSLTACVATIVCICFLTWLRSTNSATKEIIDLSPRNSFLMLQTRLFWHLVAMGSIVLSLLGMLIRLCSLLSFDTLNLVPLSCLYVVCYPVVGLSRQDIYKWETMFLGNCCWWGFVRCTQVGII